MDELAENIRFAAAAVARGGWTNFIETPTFTRRLLALLPDGEYRKLQEHLIEHPEAGSVIIGTGGARKIRWATPGSGKRGGVRVIYFMACHAAVPLRTTLYMLLIYSKGDQDDMTPSQRASLKKLIERIHAGDAKSVSEALALRRSRE